MVQRLTPAARDRMLTLYASGERVKTIAKNLGYGSSTVTLVLREARAENDPRSIIDPKKRAFAMDALFNRAPNPGTARSDDGDTSHPIAIVAPITDRLVLSLMARGMSKERAAEQAAVHRKRMMGAA